MIQDSKLENGQCIGLLNVFTVALFSKISHFRAVIKATFTLHCIPDRFCAGTKAILDKASVCKHIIIKNSDFGTISAMERICTIAGYVQGMPIVARENPWPRFLLNYLPVTIESQ